MKLTKNLHWFIYIIFILSCARQSAPTGGPKDTIPPKLVRSIPGQEATNFKGKKIELEFSEMITLNNVKEQLIVTPTIGKNFKAETRKNSLIIELERDLADNTTYNLNFRESIQDITEKNPAKNFQLAFSTGPYIDSLSIQGTVYDMLTSKPLKEATIVVQERNDTFNILKHPATYFTKTNDKGEYFLGHLKSNNYFIYAIDDRNKNLIVDSRNESYGFLADSIKLTANRKDVNIPTVKLDARPLKLTSARPYNTYFNIKTSKNLRNFDITSEHDADLFYSFGEDNANIRFYNSSQVKDSLKIRLIASDSIGNQIDTTLYAKFNTRETTPEKFDASIQSPKIIAEKGLISASIKFTKPVSQLNFDSIFYKIDSLQKISFSKEDFTWSDLDNTLTLNKRVDKKRFSKKELETDSATQKTGPRSKSRKQTQQNTYNDLYLGKGAFISIEGDTSKRITQQIKPLRSDEMAIIHTEVQTDQKNFIVELIDKNSKVVQSVRNKKKVKFEDVMPAEYEIRLIIDTNSNGKWDPGNYLIRRAPEQIIYYKAADGSTIVRGAKANWEYGEGELLIKY